MKKPEKKNTLSFMTGDNYPFGYNQAYDDLEKYYIWRDKEILKRLEMSEDKAREQYQEKWVIINSLPNKEEIKRIIPIRYFLGIITFFGVYGCRNKIVEIIYKRIHEKRFKI